MNLERSQLIFLVHAMGQCQCGVLIHAIVGAWQLAMKCTYATLLVLGMGQCGMKYVLACDGIVYV